MLKVGLTGGLASGKTFVANVLEKLGCHVIYADRIGHEVMSPQGEAYAAVLQEFGCDILGADGQIDRKLLGRLVFGNPQRLETLNSLVHPHVFRRQEDFFRSVEAKDPAGIAIVEAAIMIEVGSYKRYDKLIVTYCTSAQQIARYMAREPATEAEARARLARQMPLADKLKFADYVIDTSGAERETERQVREVYQKLSMEARAVAAR